MSDDDKLILVQQDLNTLSQWWCDLNHWEWPAEIPDPEEPVYLPEGRRSSIMRWIENAIGMRAILHCHNVKSGRMTEDVFNDFWRGCHEGVPHARERYYAWLKESVQCKIAKD